MVIFFIWAGIASGFAALTKYPGILATFVVIMYAGLYNKVLFKNKNFLISLGLPLVILLPWFFWNFQVYGMDYFTTKGSLHIEITKLSQRFSMVGLMLIIGSLCALLWFIFNTLRKKSEPIEIDVHERRSNEQSKKKYTRITEAFRMVYYDLVPNILKGKNIPCYAGISNVHINFDGEVWPCCVLAYAKPMGNLRDFDYDFQKFWQSEKANEVRKFIKINNCECPLANQAYSNILCNFGSMKKVAQQMFQFLRA